MKPTRRSSLFLLELMLAILLFILAATICVQVFVKSHTISKKSTELTQAVLAATSVAEILRSDESYSDILFQVYPFAEETNDQFCIYYDSDWQHTNASNGSYALILNTNIDEHYLTGNISVQNISEKENYIYQLETKKYIPKEDL